MRMVLSKPYATFSADRPRHYDVGNYMTFMSFLWLNRSLRFVAAVRGIHSTLRHLRVLPQRVSPEVTRYVTCGGEAAFTLRG